MSQLRTVGLVLAAVAALVMPAAALAAPPANDNFAAAEVLSGRMASVEGNNKDATKEDGEPPHAEQAAKASVWYSWTAPADGRTHINTCVRPDAAFDTLLAVYTGDSLGTLTAVAGNDDACGFGGSSVAFDADAGVTYRIAVDSVGGTFGFFTLSLRLAPANDNLADAVTLSGETGSVAGTNEGASAEDGEWDHLWGGVSVWYSWTAPTSGPATFETCGTSLDTIIGAFTGDALDALTYVALSDDTCGAFDLSSRVNFNATAGTTYRIAVDGYETGDFLLAWNRNPAPAVPPEADFWPTISGTAREGQTLTGTPGEWFGTAPFTFTYAWVRCNAQQLDCRFIPGAASLTYTLTIADVGYRVYLLVNASNQAGTSSARSLATAVVQAAGPLNASPPRVNGEARVGEALTASDGTWTSTTPIQYAYQWQACDAAGSACTNLDGERLSFLALRAAHLGKRLRVVVTATNADGSRASVSDLSAVVLPAIQQARCVVPSLRGRTLRNAKAALRRGRCATGRVRRAHSRTVRRGRVISQTPRAGARLAPGAKVNLVVSKGRKR